MPNLDGTGPRGGGPKTGRGQGDCKNSTGSVGSNSRPGIGRRGRGSGVGRGAGRRTS
ncbi:MAG: DUF5320 domain-containing protein [bacterium]